MFKVALNAILLIIMLHGVSENTAHVIHRVVKLLIGLTALDREEFADQKDSIELPLDFVDC